MYHLHKALSYYHEIFRVMALLIGQNTEYTHWLESDMKQMHQKITWVNFWIVIFEAINKLHFFSHVLQNKDQNNFNCTHEYKLNWDMGSIIQLNTVETLKQPRMLAFSYRVASLKTPAIFSTGCDYSIYTIQNYNLVLQWLLKNIILILSFSPITKLFKCLLSAKIYI